MSLKCKYEKVAKNQASLIMKEHWILYKEFLFLELLYICIIILTKLLSEAAENPIFCPYEFGYEGFSF